MKPYAGDRGPVPARAPRSAAPGLACCGAALALAFAPARADTLTLNTGEKLVGKILTEGTSTVVIESTALGRVTVPRDRIERLTKEAPPAAQPAVRQDARAPAPAPAAEAPQAVASGAPAEGGATPPAKPKEDLLRVYWDDGLRYQVYQTIRIPVPFSQDETSIGEDVHASGRLGLRASLDTAAISSSDGAPQVDPSAEIRALRLYSVGEWGAGDNHRLYSLQFGAEEEKLYLYELWLRWPDVRYVGNFQVGYMAAPRFLEGVGAFGSQTFMEQGSVALAFGGGNRTGLQIDRTFHDDRLSVTAGVWSVASNPGVGGGEVMQSLVNPALRVTSLPILEDQGAAGSRFLHLGGSISYSVVKGSTVRFQSRPESMLAPYVVDTGPITAKQTMTVGLEAIYGDGPFTLQSEAALTSVDGEHQRYDFLGEYISVGWFLTGEQRGYDRATGSLLRVAPLRPFSWANHTWGAWEVAARLSHLDLDSGDVRGGVMDIGTAGVNWYWNRHLRWLLDYGYAHTKGGVLPGTMQIAQLRLQLLY
ncbi:MAG TPA: porin [Steroidobacteraceae bacterium]|nr:porin [Steroidobacteraceae bacterium]